VYIHPENTKFSYKKFLQKSCFLIAYSLHLARTHNRSPSAPTMNMKPEGLKRVELPHSPAAGREHDDAQQQAVNMTMFSLATPAAPIICCQERSLPVYFGTTDKYWKAGSRGASTADVDVELEAAAMGSCNKLLRKP
jgi:hypothetical protein